MTFIGVEVDRAVAGGILGILAVQRENLVPPAQNRMSTEFHEFHGFKMVGTIRESEVIRWGLFVKKLL